MSQLTSCSSLLLASTSEQITNTNTCGLWTSNPAVSGIERIPEFLGFSSTRPGTLSLFQSW